MKPKIQALISQAKSGKAINDSVRVLRTIIKHPHITMPDIESNLNMLHQTAAARVSDLLDMGVIESAGEQPLITGSAYSMFRFQPDPQKQVKNALERKMKKFQSWTKKGINEFSEYISRDMQRELSSY